MAYKETPAAAEIRKRLENQEDSGNERRICCPLCQWSPAKSSLWFCADADAPEYFYGGCGTMWNTFETRGKCPVCRHQWRWTSCLRCGGWSRHEDWYQ